MVHQRNLQLMTPIFDSPEVSGKIKSPLFTFSAVCLQFIYTFFSVMSYLKYSLQAQVLTSNDIDQAVASGVDLSEVTLNDTELVSDIIKTNDTTEPATTYQRMVSNFLTVWKFENFPFTQILREIIFGECQSSKNAIFLILRALKLRFCYIPPSKK